MTMDKTWDTKRMMTPYLVPGSYERADVEPVALHPCIPMAGCLVAFLYVSVAYNGVFLGRILPTVGKEAFITPFQVAFNLSWFLAAWSYLRAHLADAGSKPPEWNEFVKNEGDALPHWAARPEWQPGKATFCKKCLEPRPERAHHCTVCKKCVLRMDHHCPWIGNCVGLSNYKFFLLLNLYSSLACVIALVSALPEFVTCMMVMLTLGWDTVELTYFDVVAFVAFYTVTLTLSGFMFQMVFVHLPLAMQNLTTIEENYENMDNPFDQMSTQANLSQVLGAPGLDWVFPVTPWRLVTDGIYFPCNVERLTLIGTGVLEQVLAEEEASRLATESTSERRSLIAALSLKSLRGKWVIENDPKTTIAIQDNGHTLYNGRHWGNQLDLTQRNNDERVIIERADGWSIDMENSNADCLLWKRGADAIVKWRRVEKEERSWEKLWRLRYRNPPQSAQRTNVSPYVVASPRGRIRGCCRRKAQWV